MQFNLVNNEEQALHLWTLSFSAALRISIAVVLVLQCVLALRCTLSVVLFPQASSVLFYPYLQYVHLATVALKKSKSNLKNFMDQIWMHIL